MRKKICKRSSRKVAKKKKRSITIPKKSSVHRTSRPNKKTQWGKIPVVEEDEDKQK